MSRKPLVSIIITTKNEASVVESLLLSIKNQSYENLEILVVDNNSSDITKSIARRYTKNVYDRGPERSAQRNFGARKARGEYILFLDADMQLEPDVISECVEKIRDNDVGAIIIPEVSFGETFWAKVKSFERSFYVGDESIEAPRFFRKSFFLSLGGFDESITGPEDWDLSFRVRSAYKIVRCRSSILHNEGNLSLIKLMKKKYYYGIKLSVYLRKHPFHNQYSQTIYFLRPAFYKKWKKMLERPFLTIPMLVMLFCEQVAGFTGFVKGLFFVRKQGTL